MTKNKTKTSMPTPHHIPVARIDASVRDNTFEHLILS